MKISLSKAHILTFYLLVIIITALSMPAFLSVPPVSDSNVGVQSIKKRELTLVRTGIDLALEERQGVLIGLTVVLAIDIIVGGFGRVLEDINKVNGNLLALIAIKLA